MALRRQQAQEENEARELGLLYNPPPLSTRSSPAVPVQNLSPDSRSPQEPQQPSGLFGISNGLQALQTLQCMPGSGGSRPGSRDSQFSPDRTDKSPDSPNSSKASSFCICNSWMKVKFAILHVACHKYSCIIAHTFKACNTSTCMNHKRRRKDKKLIEFVKPFTCRRYDTYIWPIDPPVRCQLHEDIKYGANKTLPLLFSLDSPSTPLLILP